MPRTRTRTNLPLLVGALTLAAATWLSCAAWSKKDVQNVVHVADTACVIIDAFSADPLLRDLCLTKEELEPLWRLVAARRAAAAGSGSGPTHASASASASAASLSAAVASVSASVPRAIPATSSSASPLVAVTASASAPASAAAPATPKPVKSTR